MPARRNQGPPPIEVKQFTLEEIDAGVRKLKRRIDEVKALASQTVRFDDARVESATRNIKADIIDIFGRHSPEYLAHGSHSVGYPEQIEVTLSAIPNRSMGRKTMCTSWRS